MKSFGLVLFCSLLMTSMLTALGKNNPGENGDLISSNRQKRSMVFFPSGSSEDYNEEGIEEEGQESTLIGISVKPLEKPELAVEEDQTEEYFSDNLYNNGSHAYDALTLLEEPVDEDIMERSFGGGISRIGVGKRRRPQISFLGAAINALNPITYMRGTFKGFRNVFMQNMMPFKRRFGSNRKDIFPPKLLESESTTASTIQNTTESTVITTTTTTGKSEQVLAAASSSETVSSTSSLSPDKGLDLKIPPELVNYAALEVNLKPNGDINIVPVTTRPVVDHNIQNHHNFGPQHGLPFGNRYAGNIGSSNSQNTGVGFYNNGGGNHNNQGYSSNRISQNNNNMKNMNYHNNNNNNINHNAHINHNDNQMSTTNNHIASSNIPNGGNNINMNTFNNNKRVNSNGHLYNGNNIMNSDRFIDANKKELKPNKIPSVKRPNIVKLVTDRPMVVQSIQDVINFQNTARNERIGTAFGDRDGFDEKITIPVDVTNLYTGPSVDSSSKLRLPSLNKTPSPDHIYLLPFRVNPSKGELASSHSIQTPRYSKRNNKVPKSDVDASEIYYIDITIPEKQDSAPVVNHQKFVTPKKIYRRRRYKRNSENKSKKEKDKKAIESVPHQMEYDGWQPIDNSDPMSNEPTLVYKPPTLKRVHFGEDPPKEKPLYPVVPVNPPVYVIRAEPTKKEIHSVYGTENVDYLHVNPQTDSATAYSAFGGEKKIRSKKERHAPPKSDRNSASFSLSDIIQSFIKREKDSNDTTTTKTIATTFTTRKLPPSTTTTTRTTAKTTTTSLSTTEKSTTQITTTEANQASDYSGHTEPINFVDPSINFLQADNENKTSVAKDEHNYRLSDSIFAEKVLALDEDYYYVYDDVPEYNDNNKEKSADYEYSRSTKSDPFASIIPKEDSSANKKEDSSDSKISTENAEDEEDKYIAQGSENVETRSVQRASLFELLKNFDGVQFDPYIFSASENNEETFVREVPPPKFRARESFSRKIKGPQGRHIEFASKESSARPWYLIETREPPQKPSNRRKKTEFRNRKNFFGNIRASKITQDQYIYNPYLEDHLNSFKPTDSLTANSLSELLQIFKYVTTPSPAQKFFDSNSFPNKPRIFRYTKPTESPRHGKAFTTFRYTIPVSKPVTSTEASFNDDPLAFPPKFLNDTVAETNSLDGYLFSDSVAAPEYTRPDAHPNVIRPQIVKSKHSGNEKKEASKEEMMDKDAIQRGEIAPPFVIEVKEATTATEDPSPYYIHEGHSRVRVFGSNKNESVFITTTEKPLSSTLDHILISPSTPKEGIAIVPASSTTQKPLDQMKENSQNKTDVKYYDINEFRRRISVDDQLTVNKNVPKWRADDEQISNSSPAQPYLKPLNAFPLHFNQRQTKDGRSLNISSLSSPIEVFFRVFMDYLQRTNQKIPEAKYDASVRRQPLYVPRADFKTKGKQRESWDKSFDDSHRSMIEAFLSNPFEYLEYLRMLEETQTK